MKKTTLFLIVFLMAITACNKIDTSTEVFTITMPVTVTQWDPDYAKTVVQKIYVEEFTGHTCIYCPNGAAILKTIMEEDPTIIATAIHCTSLAAPLTQPPFDNDYRTPMGDRICSDFKITGLPKAMINRKGNGANGWEFDRNKWRSTIAGIDRNNVKAGIQLQCHIDTVKQVIEAQVAVTIIKNIPNPVQLCLLLQQDGFISGQLNGNQEILDYEHTHVLRAGFNGNYGMKLTSDGVVKEQFKYSVAFKLAYSNSFPNSFLPLKMENCSVVAYLLDMTTKEVVQVEEVRGER